MVFSVIMSLLVGFITYTFNNQLTALYFNQADSMINAYFEDGVNKNLVISICLVLNTADIL